ncbi:hypothetical protein [Marinobacter sp.]|uniref:hypothetical protein n=1 Tax=Marinobacter sp. TaxID=50741 RepID=UPI003A8EC0BE
MNRTIKPVTVHFFSIEASHAFFEKFRPNFLATTTNSINTRIINVRSKKHLIKAIEKIETIQGSAYAFTVVRERNTWQTKATRDGRISGISINQGIIGDAYYFFVVPNLKIVLGFTPGLSGSLKTVGKTLLEQFKNDRLDSVSLNLIPKETELFSLSELAEYNSLHFKISSSSLTEISDDAPQLIKDLSAAPYIENNVQLALDLEFNDLPENAFSKENIFEIVSYLSDHDGCSLLKVKGLNNDGQSIHLDFGNAFFSYKTEISTRKNYVDENSSIKILNSALSKYHDNIIPQKTT